jgi:MtfA peptidase
VDDRWDRFARGIISRFGGVSASRLKQRQAILSTPFPQSWAEWLEAQFAQYRRLPPEHRARFHQQVQIFLAEKRLTGIETDVTEESRIQVAASAVMLTAGWQDYTWDQLAEVLLYPDDFDRDYQISGGPQSGIAHSWGVVILSVPALDRGFSEGADGHVGFHEFAHLLDLSQTRFDGVPSYLTDDAIRQWLRIVEREEERLRRGDSVLDPYALSSPVELFPVAVEVFFLAPVALADRHRELYDFLSSYFVQDPAAWTDSEV